MINPTDPPPAGNNDYKSSYPWNRIEDRISRGEYTMAIATLRRIRQRTTNPEDLAHIDERITFCQQSKAARNSVVMRKEWLKRYPPDGEVSGEALAIALFALIIATAVVLQGIRHESSWWAALIVTVLAPPALLATSFKPWSRLAGALPSPLGGLIAVLSTGYVVFAAFVFSFSTTLLCIGAFMSSLFVTAYPIYVVVTLWYNRRRPVDHL